MKAAKPKRAPRPALFVILMVFFTSTLPLQMAHADDALDLLEAVSERLSRQKSLEGEFRQRKQLPHFERPFESTGNFRLSRDKGLYWQVESPAPSVMEVHEGRVVLDGRTVQDHGVGKLMSQLMLGFMDGDLSGVTPYFDIDGELYDSPTRHGRDEGAEASAAGDSGWQLQLTPRGRLARVMTAVNLAGDRYLQHIEIAEAGGSTTFIEFQPQSAPRFPVPEEQSLNKDKTADDAGDAQAP